MHARLIRLVTALAVIGMCVWPVWKGFDVIGYAVADATPEAVRPFIDLSGVGIGAREVALTTIDNSSDDKTIRKRLDEIAQILALRPLSSRLWLQLAEARIDAQEPLAKALDALEMSTVTGPNEEAMLTQRGLFGIWQWEALPPETQQRAIADLAVVNISDTKATWLRKTLAEKSAQVRQDIRSALQAQGFSKLNFERVGL
jgi:hypothetical protein